MIVNLWDGGELRSYEWLCVSCGSPNVKDYTNYCRCAECHSDHSRAISGFVTAEEYQRQCAERRAS